MSCCIVLTVIVFCKVIQRDAALWVVGLFGDELLQEQRVFLVKVSNLWCFSLLCRTIGTLPPDSLGAYVISMAKAPSDVLAVVLLQRECGIKSYLRVVPLFETLEDLDNAPAAMRKLLGTEWYLNMIQGHQECMIGRFVTMELWFKHMSVKCSFPSVVLMGASVIVCCSAKIWMPVIGNILHGNSICCVEWFIRSNWSCLMMVWWSAHD